MPRVLQDVRQRAGMILMAMRQHDGRDLVLVLEQIGDIRDDEIDAEHIVIREHEPRVDHEDLVIHLDDGHVLADFSEPAERDDL